MQKKEVTRITGVLAIIIVLISCVSSKKMGKKTSLENLDIYERNNNGFYYLKIYDKRKSFRLNYPVGFKEFEYSGGPGPIFEAYKTFAKIDSTVYLITSYTKDSVCFLNWCFSKKGNLITINNEDKAIIQVADSFCKVNYPFYKIDSKRYKNWYSPNKQ
jgi:hypothetical protein